MSNKKRFWLAVSDQSLKYVYCQWVIQVWSLQASKAKMPKTIMLTSREEVCQWMAFQFMTHPFINKHILTLWIKYVFELKLCSFFWPTQEVDVLTITAEVLRVGVSHVVGISCGVTDRSLKWFQNDSPQNLWVMSQWLCSLFCYKALSCLHTWYLHFPKILT